MTSSTFDMGAVETGGSGTPSKEWTSDAIQTTRHPRLLGRFEGSFVYVGSLLWRVAKKAFVDVLLAF